MEQSFCMLIDGELVDNTVDHLAVTNPATCECVARVPNAGASELDRAVAAANRSFPAWRDTDYDERRRAVLAAADTIEGHEAELSRLFTLENGRPIAGAQAEIAGAVEWMRGMASFDLPVEVTEDNETRRVEVHHVPLGAVGAITAWNFPVMLAVMKFAPAILTGNTVVLKPSPFTPLCTLRIGELVADHFPAGVLNVICGGDDLGPLMTAHPGLAKITFTGSSATGKRIMESAAADLKRVTLELGGNDAAIVLPDVDVDTVALPIFFGAFANTGQVCVATKRLYVHDSIYEELRDRLHDLAKTMRVGNGLEDDVVLGPIQNERQYRRVQALLADARESGLTLLEGADVPEEGYFIKLAIVDNPPEDARVVSEEAFGPVLPMMRYSDLDDVVARANNSEYGLAGAIWSGDPDAAVALAKRLETGRVWINEMLVMSHLTPQAGHKQSGVGAESGIAGLMEFTQPKAIWISRTSNP